jgi:Integrase zinc binding domain
MTMLPELLFINSIDIELHDLLAESIVKDNIIIDALKAIKHGGTPPMKSSIADWKIEDSLLFFRDQCYVPPDVKLQKEIVKQYHKSLSTGHPRQFQTLELVRRDYWWPGMTIFIKNYVDGCVTCQQMKVNTHPTTPPLSPITALFTCIWKARKKNLHHCVWF